VPKEGFTPGFLIASLAITLTLGSGSGLFYLWRMGLGADVPISHRQIHAHSQVLGFAALFILGIAFHTLPAMLGGAPAPARLRSATLWLIVSGVVLRNLAQPFAFFRVGGALALLSGLLEAAGGTLFVTYLVAALREQPRAPRDPLQMFLPIAVCAFLAALALSVVQGAWLAARRDATLPSDLTEPFYTAALFGFVLAFVFAFAGRMLPGLLGTGPVRPGTFVLTAALQITGLVLALASWLSSLSRFALELRDAGACLLALAAIAYLAGTGFLWRRARPQAGAVPGSPGLAIRLAFASLALWAGLTIAAAATARLTHFPARNPWWTDAARHVFTIGFLMLVIVGVSLRVVPLFSGRPLYSPRLARLTYVLLAAGVLMRLLEYPAAFHPDLYRVGSTMGVPVVLALVLFTINVMKSAKKSAFAATLPAR
jgi:hypothetical protein